MELTGIVINLALGLLFGAGLSGSVIFASKWIRRRHAAALGARLRAEAATRAESILSQAQQASADLEARLRLRTQKEVGQKAQRLKAIETELRDVQSRHDREIAELEREHQSRYGPMLQRYQRALERDQRLADTHEKIMGLRETWVGRLEGWSSANRVELLEPLVQRQVEDGILHARKRYQMWEEDTKLRAEQMARQTLASCLSRFPRSYCPERGIGIVAIPNESVYRRLTDDDRRVLRKMGELCGVDVSITENKTLAVSGFDPVRRELTTRCLEKVVANRGELTDRRLEEIVESTKRDLFKRIETDGRTIAEELGQGNLHPEIQKMLGSLRYRYSYAQNQYFHVGEVGWLAGLLASEIGDSAKDGRRAGLLHDVGKAMDHSIEGGHAVIGADFIQNHGEAPHIVHAVRAHHFEEQPGTDLAFLVIAADAISGARPGARRSTVTAYNQKMEALETIGDQVPGVVRTLVFNAGREVRLIVNAHKVSDRKALDLCQTVAKKIEDELAYPGSIKVVVVRETVAEAFAK